MKILLFIFLLIFIKFFNLSNKKIAKPIFAIAYFNDDQIKGTVEFIQKHHRIKIILNLTGLKSNSNHGFHVHEAGDLTDKCTSMCAHFNPFNNTHGCPGSSNRHVGDLGNIKTDSKGNAKYVFYDDVISLKGKTNIIGRGLIIHADPDDCGKTNHPDSLTTGNSGKRIACAIIGYSKKNFVKN